MTTETTPVDRLTTVAAGEVVVIVTTFGFDELGRGLIVVVITLPPAVIVDVTGPT